MAPSGGQLPQPVTKWNTERELADQLRDLTEKVRQLQDEIRCDALASRRASRPLMPIEDESKVRPVREPPPANDRDPDLDR